VDEEELIVADKRKYENITKLNLILSERTQRIEKLKQEIKGTNEQTTNEEK